MGSFFFLSYIFGVDFRSYADWLACRQYVINVISGEERHKGEWSVLCLPNLALGLFVRMLMPLNTNAYASCGRPSVNFIDRFNLGHFILIAKPLHLVALGASSNTVAYVQIMLKCLAWMWTYCKMFCILCLCIILCDTSKASENLTFVLKRSHSVESFCYHHYLLSGYYEDQRL